jgi:hypothetical protein
MSVSLNLSRKLASRRRVLRGMMGGAAVSVGLPFLDAFLNGNGTALASTGQPLPPVFGTWFWGCGLNPGRWEPNTAGKINQMGPEAVALQKYRERINVFSGFKVFTDGKPQFPHHTGNMGTLTGHIPGGGDRHPSIDTLVADVIGTRTRFRSLEMTSTGDAKHTQSYRGGRVVNPAEPSPVAMYTRIFGPEFQDPKSADFKPDTKIMLRESVLSGIADQRADFMKDLGAADQARMDEYFTSLRQLEHQLGMQLEKPAPLESCTVAAAPPTMPLGQDIEDVTTNHKLFAKLIAHALSCNQTQVFNMVYTDEQSTVRRPGTTTTHHILTHEEAVDDKAGYQPMATWFCTRIMEQLAEMIGTLDNVREGSGTLMDRVLIMASSETGYAKIHSLENIPMFTAGNGGGRIKTGQHIQAKGDPTSRLGLTLQQAMGVPVAKWGTESMGTSKAITEILA